MRSLLFAAILTIATAAQCAAEVRVFISPRSPIIPASGKMILDVYWFNSGEAPAAIPGLGEHGLTATISSRTGRTLPRVQGSSAIMSHGPTDRRIPPRTLVRDEITIKIDAKVDEFVELQVDFESSRGRRFESNTVLLVKRR